MKKWFLLFSIILVSGVQAQECNNDKKQFFWIEAIHLSGKKDVPANRVFYKAPVLWTTALPELGLMSYWTEDQQLAEPTLVIKSFKGSINETVSLKKVSKKDWKPNENLQGFISEIDLKDIIEKILSEHEEAQLLFEIRLNQATLCRQSINISRIIDQE